MKNFGLSCILIAALSVGNVADQEEVVVRDLIASSQDNRVQSVHHECWIAAVAFRSNQHTVSGAQFCSNLSDYEHKSLALSLTKCHLEGAGREIIRCSMNRFSEGICLQSLSQEAFNVYTQFLLSTKQICATLTMELQINKFEERAIILEQRNNEMERQSKEMMEQSMETLDVLKNITTKVRNDHDTHKYWIMEDVSLKINEQSKFVEFNADLSISNR